MSLQERMDALEQVMGMEGWQILRDFLTSHKESDLMSLAAPKREYPDDFYRGRVDVYQWFLEALPAQVKEYFRENALAEAGPTPVQSVGHPYAEEEGQPFLEGEDMK